MRREPRAATMDDDAVAHAARDVHALRARPHHLDVLVAAPVDGHLAAGNRADHRPAARLDVVAAQTVARAAQPPTLDASAELPMPVTSAPIFCRNSHSSTTCGSVAAWRILGEPRRAPAASSAVSVPVTDAS
jgi:hypothetical protein